MLTNFVKKVQVYSVFSRFQALTFSDIEILVLKYKRKGYDGHLSMTYKVTHSQSKIAFLKTDWTVAYFESGQFSVQISKDQGSRSVLMDDDKMRKNCQTLGHKFLL